MKDVSIVSEREREVCMCVIIIKIVVVFREKKNSR
jgi:hypothetical protein